MLRRNQVVALLKAHEGELCARGVQGLFLFGSVGRGEARAGSDVDLFFDHRSGLGLEVVAIQERVREIVPGEVDVTTDPAVGLACDDLDHPLALESTQEPAQIPGIEAQAGTQLPHVGAIADFEQERASPGGRSRSRKRSLSAPTRCMIAWLKLRTAIWFARIV